MSTSSELRRRRVLVIGAQGVLGSLLADAFAGAGWHVLRGGRRPDERPDFRHVDLDEAETVVAAGGEANLIVNAVPDRELAAERMVLERGGTLINVSALPARAVHELRQQATRMRGTVVMNGGIAPGMTNLVAADLLAAHPQADEVELVFTVSTRSTSGQAGGDFAHRGLTAVARHRTTIVALPEPFGSRRCLGFAEPDAGWLDPLPDGVAVSPYVCVAERSVHCALLAANAAGIMSRLPRAALRPPGLGGEGGRARAGRPLDRGARHGRRIAARTLRVPRRLRRRRPSTVTLTEALTTARHEPCRHLRPRARALPRPTRPRPPTGGHRRARAAGRRGRSPWRRDARPVRSSGTARMRRRRRILVVVAAALALGALAIAAIALAGGFDRTTTRERVAGGGTKLVRVALIDTPVGFDIKPNSLIVDRGTHLILDVINDGKEQHDLAVEGGPTRTRMLEPRESQRLDLGRITHDTNTWCILPGHKFFGMSLTIHVAPPRRQVISRRNRRGRAGPSAGDDRASGEHRGLPGRLRRRAAHLAPGGRSGPVVVLLCGTPPPTSKHTVLVGNYYNSFGHAPHSDLDRLPELELATFARRVSPLPGPATLGDGRLALLREPTPCRSSTPTSSTRS